MPFPCLLILFPTEITPETVRLAVPVEPPLVTFQIWPAKRAIDSLMVKVRAAVSAVLVAVMPPALREILPAPPRIEMFSVELLKVILPTVTVLLTVVFPAAEKVALSLAVQVTALDPSHQVEPPVQFPSPPAVEVPAELQVTSAAWSVGMACRASRDTKAQKRIGQGRSIFIGE